MPFVKKRNTPSVRPAGMSRKPSSSSLPRRALWGAVCLTLLLGLASAGCRRGQTESLSSTPSAASETGEATAASDQASAEAPDGEASHAATTTTESRTVSVTLTEGMTVWDMGKKLEQNGVCSQQAFVDAANSFDFDKDRYPFYTTLLGTASLSHRVCRLEGYLFPARYEFYKNMKAEDAVGVMLRGFKSNVYNEASSYAYAGMTLDQVVTLASIIEREAAKSNDMKKVSAVLHNRLRQGMPLQADATIDYIENHTELGTGEANRAKKTIYGGYYNTYRASVPALPLGPISNPGERALDAAANPSGDSYLYYISDREGTLFFYNTYEEHDAKWKELYPSQSDPQAPIS